MNATARKIEWTAPQSCAECGTGAAYRRQSHGEAICRVCGHENPMDSWNLSANEAHVWGSVTRWGMIPTEAPGAVLHVVSYEPESDES